MKDELIYFRGSPWSLKCVWAVHSLGLGVLPKELQIKEYLFPIQQLSLRFRLGQFTGPITIPILFPSDGTSPRRSSEDIIQYLNEKKSSVDLEAAHESVRKWDEKSNVIMRFTRGKMFELDDITQYLVPQFLQSIPGAISGISYIQKNYFVTKYGEGDEQIDIDEVEKILSEANQRLETSEYLVGDCFTYADISFASMLEAVAPEDSNKPITVMAAAFNTHEYFKPMFQSKYKNLLPWKTRILEKYFPETAAKDCLVPVTMKLEPRPRL